VLHAVAENFSAAAEKFSNIMGMIGKKKKIETQAAEEKTEEQSLGSLLAEDGEGQLTIDVFETPGEFVIKSTIAGARPEDVDISIDEDMVTIRGRREKDEEVREEDYLYRECFWGAFSRTVILPSAVDADRSGASFKNGILTIRLPKAKESGATKLGVSGRDE
jgi:HSP20 family protein